MQQARSGGSQAGGGEVDYAALPVGARVGRYVIQAVLGQGGFGITYRAHDEQLGRDVAIKEYLPVSLAVRQDGSTVLPRSTKLADDFGWGRERFVAEGRTLASLHDAPAIVRVFDFMELNGTAYIVMELVRGETLEDRLRQRTMSPDEVDAVLWPLLDGLEQVHDAGFLHRDIKPANILLRDNGAPTLIDFGASRAAMAGRTAAMTAIFTPGYAAAEQMTSAKQGPWTDIYGLAATLYHAIAGSAPPSAFDRMLDDAYQPLAKLSPAGFRGGVLAGIDAGLAVRASDRPQSIAGWRGILAMQSGGGDAATQVVARSIDPVAAQVAPRGPAAPVPPAGPPPAAASVPAAPSPASRVGLWGGVAAGVLVLLLLLAGAWFVLSPRPAPQVAAPATALQDMKVEDLERVLADRRAAEAAAADKRRQEDEARRRAEADAAAKQAADADLARAEAARQKAEAELARLKAELEARRLDQENQARRAEAEAAQRKAEAEMAALRRAEEDARAKAATEAEAKRLADEALAKAQAERQKAEEEARSKATAEAKEKAAASAAQIAEAEARAKVEAEAAAQKRAAEAAETALRLAPADRQRVQLALTALGFDTRGSDGVLGPRSRDMIGAWQKAHNQPVTGFLDGAQHQALLREAAPALQKHDDEQKKKEEDDKKKADEAKRKAEEEAKAKAAAATPPPPSASPQAPALQAPAPQAPSPQAPSPQAAPPQAAAAAPSPSTFDGRWSGWATLPNGGTQPLSATLHNGRGKGSWRNGRCGGDVTYDITIQPDGRFVVVLDGFNDSCQRNSNSFTGSAAGNRLSFQFSRGAATFTMTR